jgi:hypothetical protein
MTTRPFDISFKEVIEVDPLGWAQHFAVEPPLAVDLVDADLATVAASADKVLRIRVSSGEYVLNLEAQSNYDADLAERLHLYATLLRRRHALEVQSVALLLRPEANVPALTGIWECRRPGEPTPYRTFQYQVVRVWQQPLAAFLEGPLGLLPLAPLTNEASAALPEIIERLLRRTRDEASGPRRDTIEWATFLLLGVRYEQAVIEALLQGVPNMQESSLYQILEAREARGRFLGEVASAREMLLLVGRERGLGDPSVLVRQRLDAIHQLSQLQALIRRVVHITSWEELFADSPSA